MRNILIIIRKELLRVFKDTKLVLSLFILPGLMLYSLYSIMGSAMENLANEGADDIRSVYTVNMPEEVSAILLSEELNINARYNEITNDEIEDKQAMLYEENGVDLIIVFEEDFANKLEARQKPEVKMYYNPTINRSYMAFQEISAGVNIYKEIKLTEIFDDIELLNQEVEEVFDEKKAAGQGFAMLIPFLIIAFLFSGCMSVAPESIAGEKERGTIATILITPIKRSELALGKIIALSILATCSAISSFIGLMLSLPKLMAAEGGMNTAIYGAGEYILILFILISTVLFIIGAMSIISSYAKSIKEATAYIMPFMLLSMVIGITSMFTSTATDKSILYLIPIYNSVQSIMSILTFDIKIYHLILTIVSNVVYISIFSFILSKLFNNEKAMFSQ